MIFFVFQFISERLAVMTISLLRIYCIKSFWEFTAEVGVALLF